MRTPLAAALVVVLAGCGSSQSTASHAVRQPAPRRSGAFIAQPGRTLVSMKDYSVRSLMWQIVSLDANGTGILVSYVGEVSGAERRTFHLPARQVGVLRRLVDRARTVPEPTRGEPMADIDWLHIAGAKTKTIHGPASAPLDALVTFLGGLMQTYCC